MSHQHVGYLGMGIMGRAHGPGPGPGPGGRGSGRLEMGGVGGRSPPTYE